LLLPDQNEVDTELLNLAAGDGTEPRRTLEPPRGTGVLDAALNELERRLIQDAMSAAGGNQSEAARQLGVSRVGLIKKLTRLGLR
jgi:two-component system NtrC family response regulator